ncbi:hypothetical protein BDN72DRAFT_955111 [Pluteus cervinus]|uniref:Uncharacterized protein n=1 Tax=Pluteus cervinus TaxID=181527 RepID=A0ACD3BBK3_9AGAR|nr:hypothetical protein BDN72DRAFT_955111 [Pluteus cervinus]
MSSILVQRLGKILGRYANPNVQIPDFLCKVVTRRERELTPQAKEHILQTLSTRLSRGSTFPHTLERTIVHSGTSMRWDSIGLSHVLTASVLSSDVSSEFVGNGVGSWAYRQAKDAFSPSLSPSDRWNNLLLLGICNGGVTSQPITTSTPSPSAQFSDWKVIFCLATLEKTFHRSQGEVPAELMDVLRPLWEFWRDFKDQVRPPPVSLPVIVAFFRLAGYSKDAQLTRECFRFCNTHQLWDPDVEDPVLKAQLVKVLATSYAIASMACKERKWSSVFSELSAQISGRPWQAEVMKDLILHYFNNNVLSTGYDLYSFSRSSNVTLSFNIVRLMCLKLASHQAFQSVCPLLESLALTREQKEELITIVLDSVRQNRRHSLAPTSSSALGRMLIDSHKDVVPSVRMWLSINYIIPVLIASGQPRVAIELVNLFRCCSSEILRPRTLLRIARTFIRYRHFREASQVLRHFTTPNSTNYHFKRKVMIQLLQSGAHRLARSAQGFRNSFRKEHRSLFRVASGQRFRKPSRRWISPNQIKPIFASTKGGRPHEVKFAISILVRARRVLLAKGLLGRYNTGLDARARTEICNMIIHGMIEGRRRLDNRRVRNVIRMGTALQQEFGFVQDRVTVNILLKAILLCYSLVDSDKMKHVFNSLVLHGYPMPPRWRRHNGLPFPSLSSPASVPFKLPSLSLGYSFGRHIRPLYKLFIKGFHLRQDPTAAHTLIGILKDQEILSRHELETRNRARRLGILKKRKRDQRAREESRQDTAAPSAQAIRTVGLVAA